MKRGPYRQYLQNINADGIPEATYRYRLQKRRRNDERNDHNEIMIEDEQEEQYEQEDEQEERYEQADDESAVDTNSEEDTDENTSNSDYDQSDGVTVEDRTIENDSTDEEVYYNAEDQYCDDRRPREEDNQEAADIEDDGAQNNNCQNNFICDERENDDERTSLYENCQLTQEESELLVMYYTVRHSVTEIGLQHLIELIDLHLPVRKHISKYEFLKKFNSPGKIIVHYYCPDCKKMLDRQGEDTVSKCDTCKKEYDNLHLKKNGQFFIYIPLTEQIRHLVEHVGFQHFKQDHEDNTLSDITSGKVYRDLVANGTIGDNDISIQFNTDGVQTHNSSKASMWPIQVSINELPCRLRNNNIMLCGLWYGNEKPDMNLYLKPFVDEMNILHSEGLQCIVPGLGSVTVKVHTLLGSLDSVARPIVQNMNQFNGKYGCSYCLHSGKRVKMGQGFSRVYCGDKAASRTISQHNADVKRTVDSNVIHRGVKGPTILSLLPIWNLIICLPPDYMHCILLGVVKLFATSWFNSQNNAERWYINKAKTDIFNQRLKSIFPPCEITRVPRSTSEMKNWKAAEWKHFLLYYSLPCLRDLIPSVYYEHWALLVFSIHIFLKEKITEAEFKTAKRALRTFVLQVEDLYGKEFMKYNVHLLLHIPDSVRSFGLLWAWSAFPYESYNSVLKNFFKNSQCIPQQICKNYLRLKSVQEVARYIFDKPNHSISGKGLLGSLSQYYNIKKCRIYSDLLRVFGTPTIITLSRLQKLLIEQLLHEDVNEIAEKYDRFTFKNVLYHTTNYNRLQKRNNSTIKVVNCTFMLLTDLVIVKTKNTEEIKYVIIGRHLQPSLDKLTNNTNFPSARFSSIVRLTNNLKCDYLENILEKCVNVNYEQDISCIFSVVNHMERE